MIVENVGPSTKEVGIYGFCCIHCHVSIGHVDLISPPCGMLLAQLRYHDVCTEVARLHVFSVNGAGSYGLG